MRTGKTGASTMVLAAGLLLSTAASVSQAQAATDGLARPAETRSSSELRGERTAYSSSWITKDGRKVTRIGNEPIRWKDRAGAWRPFDLGLRKASGGQRDAASVADAQVSLPAASDGSQDIAIDDGRGSVLRLGLENARPRAGVRKGDQGREYRGVQPGVTQRATVTSSGVKEELVLDGPAAPRKFSYRLRVSDGLVPVVQRDGSLNVLRGTSVVFTIPRAVLNEDQSSEQSAAGSAYRIRRLGAGDWRLAVDADGPWIRDATRQWPVVVDPTVTVYRLAAGNVCRMEPYRGGLRDGIPCDPATPPSSTVKVGQVPRACLPSAPQCGSMEGYSVAAVRGFVLPAPVLTGSVVDATLNVSTVDESLIPVDVSQRKFGIEGTTLRHMPWYDAVAWSSEKRFGPAPESLKFDVTGEVRNWIAPAGGGSPQPAPVTGRGFFIAPKFVVWEPGLGTEKWLSIASNLHPDVSKRPYLDVYTAAHAQAGSEVRYPREGKLTSRFVDLQAAPSSAGVTTARFEYVAGSEREWRTIPLAALRIKETGQQPTADEIPVTAKQTPELIWDLSKTPGGDVDGPVHVRALLDAGAGSGGGVTPLRNFRLDRKNPETSSQQEIGPAKVDLSTGDVGISTTDADVRAFLNDLQLSRTYHSRGGSPRTTDMFGPGWVSSFEVDGGDMPYRGIYNFTDVKESEEVVDWSINPTEAFYETFDAADLTIEPVYETTRFETKYAVLEKADGSKITFRQDGSNWVVDNERPDVKVQQTSSGFTVSDADGGVTTFEPDKPGSPNYRPINYNQPGSTKNTTFQYDVIDGRKRLTRVLAPVLTGVSCSATSWTAGCRALELGWGDIAVAGKTEKRVTTLKLRAVDPSGAVVGDSRTIANYEYDATGRLKKVSDPRVSGGLPTQYAYDTDGRLTTYTPPGERPWTFAYQAIDGDAGNGRVRSITRKTPAGADATTTFVYNVPLSGAGAPNDLSATAVAAWGQADRPWTGTAVFPPDAVPSGTGTPSSWNRATINYLGVHGKTVNVADPAGNISTSEFDEYGNVMRELTPRNRERVLASSGDTVARSRQLDSQYDYAENHVDLERQFGPEHRIRQSDGTTALARDLRTTNYDLDKPASISGDQHLPSEIRVGAYRTSDGHVIDEQVTRNFYSDGANLRGWQVRQPLKTTFGEGAEAATTTLTYHPDYPLLTEKRMPKASGTDSHAMVYHYYGIGSTAPSWCTSGAGLTSAAAAGGMLCAQTPGAQPASGPDLPGAYVRYSLLWDPVEERKATSPGAVAGSPLRTTTIGRDVLGRETSRSVTATSGRAIPSTTSGYDAATGKPTTTASAALGSEPARSTTRVWDDNGRLSSYADADGGTTTYSYDLNGRLTQTVDPRGTRALAYDDRDQVSGVIDSRLSGSITATRDADGGLVEQTLPGSLKMTQTIDENGQAVEKKWERTSGCSGSACVLSSSSVIRDGHGRISTTDSGDSSSEYGYDVLGRLASAKEQRGDVCAQRDYAFDKNSNRTSSTSKLSGPGGACGTGAATTKSNTLDGADRLKNTGYAYDALGRTTTVPAADSPDNNQITLTYDSDDFVASISAGPASQTISRDPIRRLRSDTSQTTGLASTTSVLRYGNDDDVPTARAGAWGWERYVADVDGTQIATVTDDGKATWEPTDIRGNVVVSVPAVATEPVSGRDYDEFGNVTTTSGVLAPQGLRHGWLGGYGKHSAFTPGGLVHMGVRVYNPVSGRFLQVDPIEGGSSNAYDYCGQDPVNCLDLDGQQIFRIPSKCSLFPWMCAIKNAIVKPIDGARCVGAITAGAAAAGKGIKAAISFLKGGDQITRILKATKSKDAFVKAVTNGKKGVTFGGLSLAAGHDLVQWLFNVEGIVESCKRLWPKG